MCDMKSMGGISGALLFALALTATLSQAALAAPDDRGGGNEKDNAASTKCVLIESEARYGAYGYDHLVNIDNTCAKNASCSVKTDVNPQLTQLTVRAHEKTTVVTFRGSPSREFKADVECKLDP